MLKFNSGAVNKGTKIGVAAAALTFFIMNHSDGIAYGQSQQNSQRSSISSTVTPIGQIAKNEEIAKSAAEEIVERVSRLNDEGRFFMAAQTAGDTLESTEGKVRIKLIEEFLEACEGLWAQTSDSDYADAIDKALLKLSITLAFQNREDYHKHRNAILGERCEIKGEFSEAMKYYNEALTEQHSAEVLFKRGRCYIQLKEYNKAIKDLKDAIELTGDEKTEGTVQRLAYHYLGRAYHALGDVEKARECWEASGRLAPWYGDEGKQQKAKEGNRQRDPDDEIEVGDA